MSGLQIQALSKSYGTTKVLHDIDLAVASGAFVVFVGPSGCGKSTLLRTIAGLEEASSGKIMIDAADVTKADPSARGIAMVFQTYALYPHMTVEENMAFGLEMAGVPKPERKAIVAQAAELLQLTPYLSRKPKALSGGQRQRVAIGRAIVRQPKIFLFDEPLSNLDAELRVKMRMELAALHKRLGATMIYVTHDQVEAMTLADQIVVLNAGRIAQTGAPMALYENPDNAFVAGFIGSPRINFLPAKVVGHGPGLEVVVAVPALGLQNLRLSARDSQPALGTALTLGLRPEHFIRAGQTQGTPLPLQATAVENLGAVSYAHCKTGAEELLVVEFKEQAPLSPGQSFACEVIDGRGFLFDASGARV